MSLFIFVLTAATFVQRGANVVFVDIRSDTMIIVIGAICFIGLYTIEQ